MQRLRIKYAKGPELRFIGHLDMVRLWERAIRRTDIPVCYSEGFNPRQKLSFGPPLSLGIASQCEMLDIFLDSWMTPETVKEKLAAVLPKGIGILESKNIFSGLASLTAAIKEAWYSAETDADPSPIISSILSSDSIMIDRKTKQVDIRPFIKDIHYKDGKVVIGVKCDNNGTLKGSEISGLFKDAQISQLTRIYLL